MQRERPEISNTAAYPSPIRLTGPFIYRALHIYVVLRQHKSTLRLAAQDLPCQYSHLFQLNYPHFSLLLIMSTTPSYFILSDLVSRCIYLLRTNPNGEGQARASE